MAFPGHQLATRHMRRGLEKCYENARKMPSLSEKLCGMSTRAFAVNQMQQVLEIPTPNLDPHLHSFSTICSRNERRNVAIKISTSCCPNRGNRKKKVGELFIAAVDCQSIGPNVSEVDSGSLALHKPTDGGQPHHNNGIERSKLT